MSLTLSQKHPLKGMREFQLVDDEIQYTINSPLRKDSLSVVLNVLNPEPVISGSTLSFLSKINKEPLIELFLDKPDKTTFDEFIQTIQSKIREEDFSRVKITDDNPEVDVARLDQAIELLQQYINPNEIDGLLTALNELKTHPHDVNYQNKVADEFNELGFVKGQVITYAPYINYMLSHSRL